MTNTAIEGLPEIWDDASDLPFFRITGRLFSVEFCLGASVLLASNADDEDTARFAPSESSTRTTPATAGGCAELARDFGTARVRPAR